MSTQSRLNRLEKIVKQLTHEDSKIDVYILTTDCNEPVYAYSFPSEKSGKMLVNVGCGFIPPNIRM